MMAWLRPVLVLLPMAVAQTSFAQLPSASGVDWSQAQPINVLMADDRFVPDRLTFRHGVPYQLHLENHGKELHEFTAPAFFADAVVRDPGALANGGEDVVLRPGVAADIYLMPLKAGTYRLICAEHDWDGMIGEIIVE
jgi:uncharacterized cupredoxin-like copper-binding protein